MIRPATAEDVLELAPRLRAEDIQEIEALVGLGPLEALSVGFFDSYVCMAAVDKHGTVCGLFGIAPYDKETSSVWLLTSAEIVDNARELLTTGRKWLDEQQAQYPVLTNFVTESNALHITLIKHLGFKLGEPFDLPSGEDRVIQFERKATCVDL